MASPERFQKDGTKLPVGLESEVAIYKLGLAPENYEALRDAILRDASGFTDVELGAAQIELRTSPVDILSVSGFNHLGEEYQRNFAQVKKAAEARGAKILRFGSNPYLPIRNTPRTNKPKYRLVPDFYNENRRKDADTVIGLGRCRVDIGDAAIVSLFQSFQVNMEASSFEDAIRKMNISFAIAPYLLGFSANSRYLGGFDLEIQDMRTISWEKSHDTRIQDLRMIAWEKSFDVRTREEIRAGRMLRVGLPERYFIDMADYLGRAGQFPFILHNPNAALAIAIGMTWLDTRVKFIQDSLVVELRLLPTQPTIEEELLITLFYIGRVRDAILRDEQLLPFECVRENRLAAMLYGMHRPMWFLRDDGALKKMPYRMGMRLEIERAERGLRELGLLRYFDTELLAENFVRGTPSDRLAKKLAQGGRNAR